MNSRNEELRPGVSVVVPCLDEEAVIIETLEQIAAASEDLDFPFPLREIVVVNDGSSDETSSRVTEWARKNLGFQVVLVELSRNFGHQAAILAGLEIVRHDVIVTLDADLQDPPRLIGEMYQELLKGFQLVRAVRSSRLNDSAAKRILAGMHYWLFQRIAPFPITEQAADYTMMRRDYLEVFLPIAKATNFPRGLYEWIGIRPGLVEFERPERFAGEPSYNLRKLATLAVHSYLSLSRKPIVFLGWLSLLLATVSAGLLLWVVLSALLGDPAPGWASTSALILVFSSLQFFALAIVGWYVLISIDSTQRLPNFVIASRSTFEGK